MPYYLPRRWQRFDPLTRRLGLNPDQRRENQLIKQKFTIATFAHLYHPKEHLYIDKVRRINRISDVIHFYSEKNMLDNQSYFSHPLIHLPYWLSLAGFAPQTFEAKQAARFELGIPADRIVLGSFQRDTESDRVTPKLEKGPDQLCDVIEQLDPEQYFVLLAGTRRDYVEGRLEQAGIDYLNVGFVPSEKMTTLYHALDAYLVTSRVEGGPQAILEAMATKIPVYSTRVGVSNLLDPRVVFDEHLNIVEALQRPYPDVLAVHYDTISKYSPEAVITYYDEAFVRMWEGFLAGHLEQTVAELEGFN